MTIDPNGFAACICSPIFQVTALMGAHSLGRARTENSGYNGAWTPGRENTFNNEFYQLLVDANMSFRNRVNQLFHYCIYLHF